MILNDLAELRGRLWAENEADTMLGPAATWPETWGPPYHLALPHVRDLAEDPVELNRLAAAAWFAAADRWQELVLDRRQEEALSSLAAD
jgi:hypothetical protein